MQDPVLSEGRRVASGRVGRGVLWIVVTGTVLGVASNQLARSNRTPRGLAWIAEEKKLDSVEDLLHQAKESPDPAEKHAAEVVAPPPPAPSAVKPARVEPKAPPAKSAPSPTDLDDPLGGVALAGDGGVPEIPDLDRPLKVELPMVKKLFDASAALIVDAREPEDYQQGHIPGAINLPYDTAGSDPARLESLNADGKPIVIYCGGGTCEVSMSLAETLVYQFAMRRVLVYTGGFPEWTAAGYPVEKGAAAEGKRG